MSGNLSNLHFISSSIVDVKYGTSNFTNRKIINVFDKLKNRGICAVNLWIQKINVNTEDYFSIAQEITKESRLRLSILNLFIIYTQQTFH